MREDGFAVFTGSFLGNELSRCHEVSIGIGRNHVLKNITLLGAIYQHAKRVKA